MEQQQRTDPIITRLALRLAQLEVDKATLDAELEMYKGAVQSLEARIAELESRDGIDLPPSTVASTEQRSVGAEHWCTESTDLAHKCGLFEEQGGSVS